MTETFEIDLDTERVLFDGAWLTSEQLEDHVSALIAKHDRKIVRPGIALEQLDAALTSTHTLSVRLSGETAAALMRVAERQGRSAASLAREAIARALAERTDPTMPAPTPAAYAPLAAPTPAAYAPLAAPPLAAPAPIIPGPPMLSGSPVAAVTPLAAEEPFVLTPKRKTQEMAQVPGAPSVVVNLTPDTPPAAEKDWFSR